MQRYVEVKPCSLPDNGEYAVWLKVGNQSFQIAGEFPKYDAEWMKGMLVKALDHIYSDAQAELAAKDAVVREVEEEAGKARLILLLNHGHEGQYLDDGEMQCGKCGFADYDFKKPPLSELTKRIVFSLNKQIAALTQTSGELCPVCGWRFVIPGEGCCKCQRDKMRELIKSIDKKATYPPHRVAGHFCDYKIIVNAIKQMISQAALKEVGDE